VTPQACAGVLALHTMLTGAIPRVKCRTTADSTCRFARHAEAPKCEGIVQKQSKTSLTLMQVVLYATTPARLYDVCTSDRYGVVRLPVQARARHRVCNKLIIISASQLWILLTKHASGFAYVLVTEPRGAFSPIDHKVSS
jgi:hypothetical protein